MSGPSAAMQALHQALDEGARFDAEYAGGLSNHGPMALCALHRLGADAAALQAFGRLYSRRLVPAPAAQRWPAGDAWAARLGDATAWPIYRDLFAQWLHHEDAGDVLRAVLPRLMAGVGAAAFHGVIRTAHAVQAAHLQALADGLAYWACRWLDLGPLGAGVGAGREHDAAAVLRQLPVPRRPPPGDLIFQQMQAVATPPRFVAGVARLRVTDQTLETLARGAAYLYARSGNFTLLHLLTSAHAVRVLLPWLEDPLPAVQRYWQAFAAAWAASGAQDLGPPRLRPWPDIVAFALASPDDHVIKLVDSCREQERAHGGGVWRQAASRVLMPRPVA